MSTQDTVAAAQVTHPDETGITVMTALYTAALGPISLDYYLPIFSRFAVTNRSGPSWNWTACLYTLNWLIFRRLWFAACVYVAIVLCSLLLLQAFSLLRPDFYAAHEVSLWCGFAFFYFLIPGIFGNRLLHALIHKKALQAITVSQTLKGACEQLSGQAASRGRFIGLVLINALFAVAALGLYWFVSEAGAPAQSVLSTARKIEQIQIKVEKPALLPASAALNASSPAPILASSKPVPTVDNERELLLPKTEPINASATQADLAVLEAAAVRYVPRRPLKVSTTASAPGTAEAAEAAGPVRSPLPLPKAAAQYYINVGLFANDWNARYAQAALVDAGLVSFRQALMTPKGKLTRVRVGPFGNKAEADAAVKKIHQLKLDAVVIQQ